jgi:hypothetical protein
VLEFTEQFAVPAPARLYVTPPEPVPPSVLNVNVSPNVDAIAFANVNGAWVPCVMVNVCGASAAAKYVSLPACEALIVHVPVANIRTDPVVAPPTSEVPDVTEHTDAGDAVNVSTRSGASVEALIANGSAE